MLVFYPMDFSPVCTDQLNVYQEVLPELEERGVKLLGISVDSAFAHKAFRERLGISFPLLSDFNPKGEVAKAYGAYIDERGHNQRALVMIGPDLVVNGRTSRRRRWRSPAQTSSSTPSSRLPDLGSAPVPPGADDHVRGEGPLVIEYADLECPYCAQANVLIAGAAVRRVFRHFPVVSKHPRARVLAHAAEAAALQGRFWEMHDSLMADQGRLDDPHLWERCGRAGDRPGPLRARPSLTSGGRARGARLRSGVRAGVMTTPTLFAGGAAHPGVPDEDRCSDRCERRLSAASPQLGAAAASLRRDLFREVSE